MAIRSECKPRNATLVWLDAYNHLSVTPDAKYTLITKVGEQSPPPPRLTIFKHE